MSASEPVIGAFGFLASNWAEFNNTPAIIVNPSAAPADLLAWCWGEVQSLQSAAEEISGLRDGCSAEAFNAVFVHRLEPLARVMEAAMNALAQQANRIGGD
ncbi:hypothetical protein [Acidovorax sp.]|uniref:hypothetical protein n=1 Tax=Acidovorax sp. TaxID=1872122 RepID=UPI002FAA9D66